MIVLTLSVNEPTEYIANNHIFPFLFAVCRLAEPKDRNGYTYYYNPCFGLKGMPSPCDADGVAVSRQYIDKSDRVWKYTVIVFIYRIICNIGIIHEADNGTYNHSDRNILCARAGYERFSTRVCGCCCLKRKCIQKPR